VLPQDQLEHDCELIAAMKLRTANKQGRHLFLFAAMAPKAAEDVPFQGIPAMLYMNNGPIARSQVLHQVLCYLGVEVRTHVPQGHDGRRVTARAKGKVERPFRIVKEVHETLYHFHTPETEAEANAWLFHFLRRYKAMPHRTEAHRRMDDWVRHLPPAGVRAMCSWERLCIYAQPREDRLTDTALTLLADRLITLLQIEHYVTRAFEEGQTIGQKPLTPELIESVLAEPG
jgi:hypothetical protein